MSYKILEQNGIDNENVDGGAFNNFASGGRDGIVGGVLSECALTAAGSAIGISPGLVILHGIRVKVTGIETLSLSSVPLRPTSYQIVAQVTLASNGDVDFSFFIRTPQPLVQNSLYQNSAGTYQAELASFTHNPDGTISDLMKTLDVIYGAGGGDVNIEVGTVTTETLAAGLDADFDVSVRREEGTNKVLLDFDAKIPRGPSGVDEGAVHFNETQDLSDSQKQKAQENIGINPILEQLEDGTYNLVIGVTGDGTDDAVVSQINGKPLTISGGGQLKAYPVGSIWLSTNNTSPAAIMGGSWEQIQDVFLLCAGNVYAGGSTGGSAAHTHGLSDGYACIYLNTDRINCRATNSPNWVATITTNDGLIQTYDVGWGVQVASALGGTTEQAQILPPYLAVYCWRRVE